MAVTMTMPAGEYYVGDLAYVLGAPEIPGTLDASGAPLDDFWAVVLRNMVDSGTEGVFERKGRRTAVYSVGPEDAEEVALSIRHRDEHYRALSRSHTVGCILLSEVARPENIRRGCVLRFDRPFEPRRSTNICWFGDYMVFGFEVDECSDTDENSD